MERVLNYLRRREFLACLLLVVAIAAVYGQTYGHGFINLDDGDYVFQNWRVLTGLSWGNLVWAFTTGHAANWHPLTWLSHMLDVQLFGQAPGPQHLVNVLLHTLSTLLLFWFLRRLTGGTWRSAFCAALFALHPLHVESVAWISERKDVLSTLFLLLTLVAYSRYARRPGPRWYSAALAMYALGLMSKPMLVTLPFLLLLLDYWPLQRVPAEAGLRAGGAKRPQRSLLHRFVLRLPALVYEKIPFFALALISSVITFLVQRAGGAVVEVRVISTSARLLNALHSYLEYLLKMLWPAGLIPFYGYPPESYAGWKLALAGLVVAGGTVLALRFASRFPYLPFGWFWYVGTLVPVIGLVQVGAQSMADRYTYIPLIGIFVVLSWGVPEIWARRKAPALPLRLAAVAVILALSAKAWFQVGLWKDNASLFEHVLRIDGRNFMGFFMLGILRMEASEYQEAVDYYRAGLRIAPWHGDMRTNMGFSLFKLGRVEEAENTYGLVLKMHPDHPFALRNMGLLLYEQAKYTEAVRFYERSLHLLPDNLLLRVYWGNAAAKLGREQEAVEAYMQVLRLQPRQPEAYMGLGALYLQQAKLPAAIENLQKAIELKDDYAEAHTNLGIALFKSGKMEEAVSHYEKAIETDPAYAEAYYNLGVALYAQGRGEEATGRYREVIRLKSGHAEAHYNLGIALAAQGALEEAVSMYSAAIRLRPDYAEAYNNLGIALYQTGHIRKAYEAFSEAVRLRPDFVEARNNREALGAGIRNPA